MLEIGVHLLDMIRFLTNEEPVQVSAELVRRRTVRVEDIAFANYALPSGLRCCVEVSRVSGGRMCRVEAIGTAGASGGLPAGAVEGKDSWGRARYEGPAPPPGRAHRYQFRLFALDDDLDLPAGLDRKALLAAMEGHALAEASLVGVYGRAA